MDIVNDIKEQFQKPNNALIKIILINLFIYLIDCILFITSEWSRNPFIFEWVYGEQALPSDWNAFFHHPWTAITYFFSHQIPLPFHILFNMMGLYWFGYIVQDLVGSRRLISLYVLGGLVAGLIYMLVINYIPYFQHPGTLIGASGSVLAIVVGAATISPSYRFHLILIGPVKISYLALVYVFLSYIGTVGDNAGGNIAHLGGALFGFIFITLLRQGTDLGKLLFTPWNLIRGIFDKSARIKVSYKNNGNGSGKLQQAEIDAILDKIHKSGYESLNKEEKRKLFDASKQ
ncbi:MAG: rhomboid family intramembrane serine protease [Cytophagaceae bacterium]|nr:rhomboid family intramembrane serine protease [Cytophagaceae bacterium]